MAANQNDNVRLRIVLERSQMLLAMNISCLSAIINVVADSMFCTNPFQTMSTPEVCYSAPHRWGDGRCTAKDRS